MLTTAGLSCLTRGANDVKGTRLLAAGVSSVPSCQSWGLVRALATGPSKEIGVNAASDAPTATAAAAPTSSPRANPDILAPRGSGTDCPKNADGATPFPGSERPPPGGPDGSIVRPPARGGVAPAPLLGTTGHVSRSPSREVQTVPPSSPCGGT